MNVLMETSKFERPRKMLKEGLTWFKTSRRVLREGLSWADYFKSQHTSEYINMKKIIISDCDGILTDGNMSYDENRKRFKTYGCHDKELFNIAKDLGWEFLFVTDDKTGGDITDRRISNSFKLHVTEANSKEREELVNKYKDAGYIVVFIGDSPSDLNAAGRANICATTYNCFEYIKSFFHYVSKYQGGHGGFADILYQLMLMDKDDLEIYR